jgi:hypothetical protein
MPHEKTLIFETEREALVFHLAYKLGEAQSARFPQTDRTGCMVMTYSNPEDLADYDARVSEFHAAVALCLPPKGPKMTESDIFAISAHDGWYDERKKAECQFSACVDSNTYLSAEVVWTDCDDTFDEEDLPALVLDIDPWFGCFDTDLRRGPNSTLIRLTKADALAILASDPSEIKTRYPEQVAELEAWREKTKKGAGRGE